MKEIDADGNEWFSQKKLPGKDVIIQNAVQQFLFKPRFTDEQFSRLIRSGRVEKRQQLK